MAILKHITSKNADYGEAQRYLMFQYDEFTNKPILDENGRMILRKEFYIDGVNCDPFTFDTECMELNRKYNKNKNFDEIKSHHYIISFDPRDVSENGLTGERAQQLGLEYTRKNFPGHQALVCTHTDGSNRSGNIHVHIVINSLRKFDAERQDFMQLSCEGRAGCKHHLSKEYLIYLKRSVMELCEREGLHQVDLLASAEKRITEKEYHAKRTEQKKMDSRNERMRSEGITPRRTVYQTQKDELRDAVDKAAAVSKSLEEFQKFLLEEYRITLKISRGRFSYLHPDRQKPITGRMLGTCYEEDYLIKKFEQNKKLPIDNTVQNKIPDSQSQQDPENKFLFVKSDLRLVTDLQQCVKAQQSRAYAQRVKLTNLQQMARTVAYVQEHGFNTQQDLFSEFEETQARTSETRKELRSIEQKLKEVNEQIHYTGQYLANRNVYDQFLESKNKKRFRQEHQTEITLYESARKFLRERSDKGRIPSIKMLKEEKEKLVKLKESQYAAYQNLRDYQNELRTVCANVDIILGNSPSKNQNLGKQKELDIS